MALPFYLSLVRHGESLGNLALRSARTGDMTIFNDPSFKSLIPARWPLTDEGRKQANIVGEFLKKHDLESRYDNFQVSGYVRAMQTAALLDVDNAQWMINHNLRERDWGHVESMDYDGHVNALIGKQEAPLWWKPHSGENLADTMLRAWVVLSSLHRESQTGAILVCHGEFITAMQVLIEKLTDEDLTKTMKDRKLGNCEILEYTRIDPRDDTIHPYLVASRKLSPEHDVVGEWQIIKRKKYSSSELLDMADRKMDH